MGCKQLIELFRCNTLYGGRFVDQLLEDHFDRDTHRGRAAPFAGARLQHPELAAFDRKLAVLHVVVMLFEQLCDRSKLIVDFRQFLFQLADRVRCANTCDNVFALRVKQILAVEFFLAVLKDCV